MRVSYQIQPKAKATQYLDSAGVHSSLQQNRTGENLPPAKECSPSPQRFAAQELSVSLYSHGLLLPTQRPDFTATGLDGEHGAEFNCPHSRAARTVHGKASFHAKMASVGELLDESSPGHKPWHSVSCPLHFMR